MSLPKLTMHMQCLPDPTWVPIYVEVDGQQHATNMDSYYTSADVEVEVLTVHLQKNSMRVRFVWNGKTVARDVPLPKSAKVSVTF